MSILPEINKRRVVNAAVLSHYQRTTGEVFHGPCHRAVEVVNDVTTHELLTPEDAERESERQQMHLAGSSSTNLPLKNISTCECESQNSAEVEKQEVRANNNIPLRMRSTVSFYICYVLCLCLGLACVLCVCIWNNHWRGGFAWNGTSKQFNWHPVLMVTGLVVVYGYGAVLYRIPATWSQNKLPWKLLHASFMLLALILSVIGLCAVFDFHNAKKIANLYSLHSWIGIAAVALFAIQWVAGLTAFLLPCSPTSLRALLKPIHVWTGAGILVLSIAACISGINEKLFFVLTEDLPYTKLPPEGLLGNSLGVLLTAFGLVVLIILSKQEWARPDARQDDVSYTPVLEEESD